MEQTSRHWLSSLQATESGSRLAKTHTDHVTVLDYLRHVIPLI